MYFGKFQCKNWFNIGICATVDGTNSRTLTLQQLTGTLCEHYSFYPLSPPAPPQSMLKRRSEKNNRHTNSTLKWGARGGTIVNKDWERK